MGWVRSVCSCEILMASVPNKGRVTHLERRVHKESPETRRSIIIVMMYFSLIFVEKRIFLWCKDR